MLSDVLTAGCAVIGDLVGSRRARDRVALHEEVVAALDLANRVCAPVEPLAPTVGDEFQGVFHRVVDALLATLLVRASMSEGHDARFGVGIGEVVSLGPRQQDGPAWWAARDAIDHVAGGRVPGTCRTWTAMHHEGIAPIAHPDVRTLNSYLVVRDHLVTEMDGRDRRILLGLLLGEQVQVIAEREGVTPSAVSQRSRRSGATQVAFTQAELR